MLLTLRLLLLMPPLLLKRRVLLLLHTPRARARWPTTGTALGRPVRTCVNEWLRVPNIRNEEPQ